MAQQLPSGATESEKLLKEACARNVPLELHLQTVRGIQPVARGRMLKVDEEYVVLETPQVIGRRVAVFPGQEYEAFFTINETLFTFRTKVVETGCSTKLNQLKYTDGLKLLRPQVVRTGQRREAFRTSLALLEDIPVWVHEASAAEPGLVPVHARRFRGRLVDASAGGVGVLLENTVTRFNIYDPLFIGFTLPGAPKPIAMLVEIRQSRFVLNDTAVRLGLMFLPWPDQVALTRLAAQLTLFLTEVQRSMRKTG